MKFESGPMKMTITAESPADLARLRDKFPSLVILRSVSVGTLLCNACGKECAPAWDSHGCDESYDGKHRRFS